MTNYRRHRITGGCYFFTVAIHDRRLRLLTDHIEQLRVAFRTVKQHHPFGIDAIVVLPDHLHCIWTLPESDDDFSLRWRQIKTAFSRQIPFGERRSASRSEKGERGIWQRRYWEHAIRDDDDYQRHVDYIHFNPVKHGYVVQPAEWPYSSFRRFVRLGIYPHDWAESGEIELDGFGKAG